MKKLMILVSAIMMVASVNAKRVETASFEEVCVNIPARVRIVVGDTYSVNVTSENKMLAKPVKTEVRNGVLKLNMRDVETLGADTEKLYITITTPRVPRLTTSREMQAVVLRDNFSAAKDLATND